MKISLEEKFLIQDLYTLYAEVLDDGPLTDWPGLFTDKCRYEIIPRDNFDRGFPLAIMRCESKGMLKDRVQSVQDTSMYEPRYLRHLITSIKPYKQSDGAFLVTANYAVMETLQDEATKILNAGRYKDIIINSDDGLLFQEKLCVYDSVLVPNSLIYPV